MALKRPRRKPILIADGEVLEIRRPSRITVKRVQGKGRRYRVRVMPLETGEEA